MIESENYAVARDTDSNSGSSWFSGVGSGPGKVDLNDLSASPSFGTFQAVDSPGNALIRAVGVPEPSTGLLLLMGMLAVVRRRSRSAT